MKLLEVVFEGVLVECASEVGIDEEELNAVKNGRPLLRGSVLSFEIRDDRTAPKRLREFLLECQQKGFVAWIGVIRKKNFNAQLFG